MIPEALYDGRKCISNSFVSQLFFSIGLPSNYQKCAIVLPIKSLVTQSFICKSLFTLKKRNCI